MYRRPGGFYCPPRSSALLRISLCTVYVAKAVRLPSHWYMQQQLGRMSSNLRLTKLHGVVFHNPFVRLLHMKVSSPRRTIYKFPGKMSFGTLGLVFSFQLLSLLSNHCGSVSAVSGLVQRIHINRIVQRL